MAGRIFSHQVARLPQTTSRASANAGLGWGRMFGLTALSMTSGAVGAKAASKWFIKPPVIPPPSKLEIGSRFASFAAIGGVGFLSYLMWQTARKAGKVETDKVIGKQAKAYTKGLGKVRKNALLKFQSENKLVARNIADKDYQAHITALNAAMDKAKKEFDAANPQATKAEREQAIKDAKSAFEGDSANAVNKGHYDGLAGRINGIKTKHKVAYNEAIETTCDNSKAEFIKSDKYKHLQDSAALDEVLQFHGQYGEKAKYKTYLEAEQLRVENDYRSAHSTLSPTALAGGVKKERARVKAELDQKRKDARACAQAWGTHKKKVVEKFHVDNKEGIVKTRREEIQAERDKDESIKTGAKAYSDALAAKMNGASATVKGAKKLTAEKRAERSKKLTEAANGQTATITGTVKGRHDYIASQDAALEAATVAYEEKSPKQTNGKLESLKGRKKTLEALQALRTKATGKAKSSSPKVRKGTIKRIDAQITAIEARQEALKAKNEKPSSDKPKKGQTA